MPRSFAVHARYPSSPLGTINVPVELHWHFLDLWREAEHRFRRAYGTDTFTGFYFSDLRDARGASVMLDDKLSVFFHPSQPQADLRLVFQLHDLRLPDTIPAQSPLRPPNFRLPQWDDLSAAEREKIEKRHAGNERDGRTQAPADAALVSSQHTAGSLRDQQLGLPARVDVQGFKLPLQSFTATRRDGAMRSQKTTQRTLTFVPASQSELPADARTSFHTSTGIEVSPSKRRRMKNTPVSARLWNAKAPPTPDSGSGSALLQSTPPSAQQPPSSQTTIVRPSWQSESKLRTPVDTTVDTTMNVFDYDPIDDLDDFGVDMQSRGDIQSSSDFPGSQNGMQRSQSLSTASSPAFEVLFNSQKQAKHHSAALRGAAPDWSEEEDKLLIKSIRRGWNSTQILKALPLDTTRTPSSIRNRKRALKHRLHMPVQEHSSPSGDMRASASKSPIKSTPQSQLTTVLQRKPASDTDALSEPAIPGQPASEDLDQFISTEEMHITGHHTAAVRSSSANSQELVLEQRTTPTAQANHVHVGDASDPSSINPISESSVPSTRPGKLKRPTNVGKHTKMIRAARENSSTTPNRTPDDGQMAQTKLKAVHNTAFPEPAMDEHRIDFRSFGPTEGTDLENLDAIKLRRRKVRADLRLQSGENSQEVVQAESEPFFPSESCDNSSVEGEVDRGNDFNTIPDDKSFVSMPSDDDSDFREASVEEMITDRLVTDVTDKIEEAAADTTRTITIPSIDEPSGPVQRHQEAKIALPDSNQPAVLVREKSDISGSMSAQTKRRSRKRQTRLKKAHRRRKDHEMARTTIADSVPSRGSPVTSMMGSSKTNAMTVASFHKLLATAHIPTPPRQSKATYGSRRRKYQIFEDDMGETDHESD